MHCTEFVHLKIKSGDLGQLRRLRPRIVADFKARYDVEAELFVLEDGTLMDVWSWKSREEADYAIANSSISSAFQEWQAMVDVISVQWAHTMDVDGTN